MFIDRVKWDTGMRYIVDLCFASVSLDIFKIFPD